DLAVVAPGSFRVLGVEFGQSADQPWHPAHHLGSKLRGERNKPSGRIVAVLSLADEIGGDDLRIRGRIRDNHDFRSPCEHVDADSAVKDALGLRHVLVAGTDKNIGAVSSEEAEGQGGDSLYAAKIENRVCTAEIEGVEHGGSDANTG